MEIAGENFDSARRYLTFVKNRQFERVKDRVTHMLAERERKVADTSKVS